MKRIFATIIAALVSVVLVAQTLNVQMGNVTHAYKAADTGKMTYTGGQTLTIGSMTYAVDDITAVSVDESEVNDASVQVTYSGSSANVVVSGDVAPYITATVSGAHVSVIASSELAQVVTYTLSGSSTDGSFYMDGELKATFTLNGLTLNNPDGAAINIQCGKLLMMQLADGTTNTLSDGLTSTDDGSDSHKAALYVNGHTTWSGSGSLTVTGNVKHGISCDEYMELGSGLGTITVASAKSDGIHVKEYFQMAGGTVNITATGDGIDVETKSSSTDEQNGQFIVSGGTLTVTTSGNTSKALKCDTDMTISGGTVTATTTGSAEYDETDATSRRVQLPRWTVPSPFRAAMSH